MEERRFNLGYEVIGGIKIEGIDGLVQHPILWPGSLDELNRVSGLTFKLATLDLITFMAGYAPYEKDPSLPICDFRKYLQDMGCDGVVYYQTRQENRTRPGTVSIGLYQDDIFQGIPIIKVGEPLKIIKKD